MGSPLLEIQKFEVLDPLTSRPICEPVSFKISSGIIMILTGPNGVGKSSLLRRILKGRNQTADSASLDEHGTVACKISRDGLLYLPQVSASRFALPVTLGDVQTWTSPGADISAADHRLLHGLDLSRPWDSSSGGEKQRLLLSSLFSSSQRPRGEILLLDEPTNHLDGPSKALIVREIESWVRTPGTTRAALVVTHDLASFQDHTSVEVYEMKEIR